MEKSVIFILIFYLVEFGNIVKSISGFKQKPSRFISFDSNDGNVEIELDLSVPFITLPLGNKESKNELPAPLLTVNTKGIVIMAVLMASSAFIVPLFLKSPTPSTPTNSQGQRYRVDENLEWWNLGESINEVLLHNGVVTPCVQRMLCSIVTTIKNTENPTSTEKIIDGVVSHNWFEKFVNGSVLMDAISIGQGSQKDCDLTYKKCPISQNIIANSLRLLSMT